MATKPILDIHTKSGTTSRNRLLQTVTRPSIRPRTGAPLAWTGTASRSR